jgi:membrane-associated HD superfamily phosphohydrolase
MVRTCTRNHPWATFGNDMLLGIKADQKTDQRQQDFLPDNLMYDVDRATIYANGEYRPLVRERRIALQAGVQIIEQDFPLTPTECVCLLLIVSIVIALWEWKRRKTFKYWDALLMLVQGLSGCVLFVMIFSQHPTTSLNLQLLLLNPLPFFFIPAVLRRRDTRWWRILAVMIVLFAIGGLFQHYAEGMMIVALCLLIRVFNGYKIRTK